MIRDESSLILAFILQRCHNRCFAGGRYFLRFIKFGSTW